ncbi:hypothetical protein GCM10009839_61290 [Catenulispora yoronensis]|uniref:HEAT repeat domain-containing protein n=2 Tax=Catenulispora yoronensis TaxID=450799 RepID=A0ABP5GJV2_9ACTN
MVRTDAVAGCLEEVSHQGSTYSATTPVALYVAALLDDPRTAMLDVISRDGELWPLRLVLIDWLGTVAADVGDKALTWCRVYGAGEQRTQSSLRAVRPSLLRAVLAFAGDSRMSVRRVAAAAALRILDPPEECHQDPDGLRQLAIAMLKAGSGAGAGAEAESGSRCDEQALGSVDAWCRAIEESRADAVPYIGGSYYPWRPQWKNLPMWLVFRTVIAERRPAIPRVSQAIPLFADPPEADRNDRGFLRDFYNDILHQDTCGPQTVDGVPLLAAIAVDERVPPQHRFDAVKLLFSIATVSGRHEAQNWPDTPPHADPRSEEAARAAVQQYVPELLARWSSECPAVQLALAALAVVSPTARTSPALAARLQGFVDRHPAATGIGDFTRFVLDLATDDECTIGKSVETLTNAYWRGTPRSAPLRGRAFHLLEQVLVKVRYELTAPTPITVAVGA